MNEDNWNELKEHAKKQRDMANNLDNPIGNLLVHAWQDILNKMWQIDKRKNK